MLRKGITSSIIIIGRLLSPSQSSHADQTEIINYAKIQRDIFWEKLYYYAGWTLYCASPFYEKARCLQIEHIYPASWMAACTRSVSSYKRMCLASSKRIVHTLTRTKLK